MNDVRPFRFGVVAESVRSSGDLVALARRAEELGYATLTIRDHFVAEPFGEQLAPMVALTAAACATETLRVGTMVLANDYRHPVVLAKEAATLHEVSGGRFELGVGAGWLREEYERAGMAFDAPAVRVDRLEESLHLLRSLLGGRRTTFEGEHYRVRDLTVFPVPDRRPPIMVGAGSGRMLGIAGRHADSVGVLPRALPEGAISEEITERMPDTIARKVDLVRAAAGGREIELSMQVNPVFGDDPRAVAERVARTRGWDVPADLVLEMPSQFVGPPEHIAGQMAARRDRYGFSYYLVPDHVMEEFAPVIGMV
ncbi:TIGR03621 family F420-dependent LLM class oxidoreductase [Actinomadura macrotermitis]|uniref:F420-dependent glucose-6-phosphate dehydrogenase n=1 Tax=Actinomadura macrotermitis TaxID=2585200 RepID=A0A7K0BY02_9ACTN|nr:TIGR03621 family F420-dependent LLM class oxidoreductase [Actinomadura macrotermitis]MQY06068.1 F420-dependent glucose-6-phosphate dehydrogenase [Actinomadura macrotermitis]